MYTRRFRRILHGRFDSERGGQVQTAAAAAAAAAT